MSDSNSKGHYEMIYSRKDERMYVVDTDTNTVEKSFECQHACAEGTNEHGDPYSSLPVDDYPHCTADDPASILHNDIRYGTFYIHTHDSRGRDIHGGGSACKEHAFDPEQKLYPTFGCLRMHNKDGEELSRFMMAHGNDMNLHVQEQSLDLSPKQVQDQAHAPTPAQTQDGANANVQDPQPKTTKEPQRDAQAPGAGGFIGELVEEIEKTVAGVESVLSSQQGQGSAIGGVVTGIESAVGSVAAEAGATIGGVATGIESAVGSVVAGAGATIGDVATGVESAVGSVAAGAGAAIGDVTTGIESAVGSVVEGTESAVSSVAAGVGSAVDSVIEGAEAGGAAISKAADSLEATVSGWIGAAIDGQKDFSDHMTQSVTREKDQSAGIC